MKGRASEAFAAPAAEPGSKRLSTPSPQTLRYGGVRDPLDGRTLTLARDNGDSLDDTEMFSFGLE
jgi:hypothetical protein